MCHAQARSSRPAFDLNHYVVDWIRLPSIALADKPTNAATALGEIIVVQMTMAYPEFVEAAEPPLPW